MERNTIIINFFGGPCSSKSTSAAGVFHKLKMEGYEVELVTEYAKELTWQGHHGVLNNQPYVISKQLNRIYRLLGKVDIIITDSPILLGIIYEGFGCTPSFKPWLTEVFDLFNNLNFYLKRQDNILYNPVGRNQSEEEVLEIDNKITSLLDEQDITYFPVRVDHTTVDVIFEKIKWELEKEHKENKEENFEVYVAGENLESGDCVVIKENNKIYKVKEH